MEKTPLSSTGTYEQPIERKKVKKTFKDQLLDVCRERFPEAIEDVLAQQQADRSRAESVDRFICDQEVLDVLHEYKIEIDTIEQTADGCYRVPVKNHFSSERLPEGYGYKGGAARALFLRSLGIDPSYTPRDIDVIRLSAEEAYPGADREVAEEFMPEDFSHGHGVEVLGDKDRYFETRDFTLNEVIATDSEVFATRECLMDSVRHIIRLTDFERGRDDFSHDDGLGDKILAKALRFYAEAIHRYDEAAFKNIADWEFEEYFITPFWLALQLDRAYDVSIEVAKRFTKELATRGQIPQSITDPDDAAVYLFELMKDRPFYYRHAPTTQFETEQEWLSGQDSLPKQTGMNKRY